MRKWFTNGLLRIYNYMTKDDIVFWETGGMVSKKMMQNGFHDKKKQVVGICMSGQIKGTDNRHDVSIGNKWSYLTEQEKTVWKDAAKQKIIDEIMSKV